MDNIIIKKAGAEILTLDKTDASIKGEFLRRKRTNEIAEVCVLEMPLDNERQLEQLEGEEGIIIEMINKLSGIRVEFSVTEVYEYKISLSNDGKTLLEKITFDGIIK